MNTSSQRGVTLLELVVAVAILSVVATLLYGTFSRTLLDSAYVEKRARTYARARQTIEWIERDLMGSFAVGTYPTGPAKRLVSPGYAGTDTVGREQPLLDFIASSARGTTPIETPGFRPRSSVDRGDQARIIYRIEEIESASGDGSRDTALVRYELRPPLMTEFAAPARAVIARGVESIELRFFDGRSWYERWDTTHAAPRERAGPRAVETRLTLAEEEGTATTFVSAVAIPLGGRSG